MGLSHLDESGAAHMVDVSAKDVTLRTATAVGTLHTRPDVVALIASGGLPKVMPWPPRGWPESWPPSGLPS